MTTADFEKLAELCISDVKKDNLVWNNRFELTKYILRWMYDYMVDKYKLSV